MAQKKIILLMFFSIIIIFLSIFTVISILNVHVSLTYEQYLDIRSDYTDKDRVFYIEDTISEIWLNETFQNTRVNFTSMDQDRILPYDHSFSGDLTTGFRVGDEIIFKIENVKEDTHTRIRTGSLEHFEESSFRTVNVLDFSIFLAGLCCLFPLMLILAVIWFLTKLKRTIKINKEYGSRFWSREDLMYFFFMGPLFRISLIEKVGSAMDYPDWKVEKWELMIGGMVVTYVWLVAIATIPIAFFYSPTAFASLIYWLIIVVLLTMIFIGDYNIYTYGNKKGKRLRTMPQPVPIKKEVIEEKYKAPEVGYAEDVLMCPDCEFPYVFDPRNRICTRCGAVLHDGTERKD